MSFPTSRANAQKRSYYGGILIFILLILILVLPSESFFQIGALGIVGALFIIFLFNLDLGLYAMAAVSFFYGWDIVLAKYSWAKNIAYLSSINAPLIDMISLAVVCCAVFSIIIKIYRPNFSSLKFLKKPILIYGLFLLASGISVLFAYDHDISSSFKYWARAMAFVFISFVIVPVLLIKNEQKILAVLKIWFCVGVLVAIFGLSSLFVLPQDTWMRVAPYSIGGFSPLGSNHNLIAEVLTSVIPFGFYLAYRAKKFKARENFYFFLGGSALMILVELLTLSRAGWLTLFIEAMAAAYIFRDRALPFLQKIKSFAWIVGVVAGLAIVGYMIAFLTSSIVSSSDTSRLFTTRIVLFYAARSPLIGYGPGMYMNILGNTQDYVEEFGDVLDAHGFVQKILTEDGLAGLVLFVVFLFYILRLLYRAALADKGDKLAVAFLVSVLGAIFFQLFNTSYFNSVMWMPIGMALAAAGLRKKV